MMGSKPYGGDAVEVWFCSKPYGGAWAVVCMEGTRRPKTVRSVARDFGTAGRFRSTMPLSKWEGSHSSRAVAIQAALESVSDRRTAAEKATQVAADDWRSIVALRDGE